MSSIITESLKTVMEEKHSFCLCLKCLLDDKFLVVEHHRELLRTVAADRNFLNHQKRKPSRRYYLYWMWRVGVECHRRLYNPTTDGPSKLNRWRVKRNWKLIISCRLRRHSVFVSLLINFCGRVGTFLVRDW